MAVSAIRASLDAAHAAREEALPLTRSAIRGAANCIRADHRTEFESASGLLDLARVDIQAVTEPLRTAPAVHHAGFLHDAQKEYAEAAITLTAIAGRPLPLPESLGVEGPAFPAWPGRGHWGMAPPPARGAARGRAQRMRTRAHVDGRYLCDAGDDRLPDALTNGLRRTTDVTEASSKRREGTSPWSCGNSAW